MRPGLTWPVGEDVALQRNVALLSRLLFGFLCLSLIADADARAAGYPDRRVRIIVGYPAGGSTDIVARIIGNWLSIKLGQQFIVENKPGAGNNIGTQLVAQAAPSSKAASPTSTIPSISTSTGPRIPPSPTNTTAWCKPSRTRSSSSRTSSASAPAIPIKSISLPPTKPCTWTTNRRK